MKIRRLNLRTTTIATLLALSAAPALADGVVQKLMTPADKARLEDFAETRKAAIAEANAGEASDVAVLEESLARPVLSFRDFDLTGHWRCRTIKAGGLAKLVVYGWFDCRITDDGSGWKLEKTSGSQRTTGRFYDDRGERMIYLGSFHIAGEAAKPYGSGEQTDQVGYAFRTGAEEWRIEFPAPYYESKLDILQFRR